MLRSLHGRIPGRGGMENGFTGAIDFLRAPNDTRRDHITLDHPPSPPFQFMLVCEWRYCFQRTFSKSCARRLRIRVVQGNGIGIDGFSQNSIVPGQVPRLHM